MPANGLTDEQHRTLEGLAARWRERAADPDPGAAERAVGDLYRSRGAAPPAVVRCASPLAGLLAVHILRSDAALRDRAGAPLATPDPLTDHGLLQRLWEPDLPQDLVSGALTAAEALVPAPAWNSYWVGEQFRTRAAEPADPALSDRVLADTRAALSRDLGLPVPATDGPAASDGHWRTLQQQARTPVAPAPVLASLLLRDLAADADAEGLDALAALAPAVGWWWAFEHVAVLTPPPVEVHTDARGRLHHPHGPAVRFGDGFSVHAWHAHLVPPSLISPGWSAADIAGASDAEIQARADAELGAGAVRGFGVPDQRRCAAERLGWARMAADLGLPPVAEDSAHSLYDLPETVLGLPARVVVGADGTVGLVPADIGDPAAAASWLTGPAEEPELLRRAREDSDTEDHLAAFDVYTDLDEQYGGGDPHVEEVHLIGGRRLEPFAYEGAGGTYFLCGEGPRRPVLYADSEGGFRVLGRDLVEALELLAAERFRDLDPDDPDEDDPRPAAKALGLAPPDTPGLLEERRAASRAMSGALTLIMTAEGNGYGFRG
ncbi:DUF6745 domain-containing protein [Nocardiopsis sp. NPDC006139]|uniref:DUF6745 domain-containing protein n=1 Tax=Nocardiopsis sp. NPDC006139 TaxID=3154578 RepID=UPI0033BB7E80